MNPKLLSKPQRHALEAIVLNGLSRQAMHWWFRPADRLFSLQTVTRLRALGLCKLNGMRCEPTPEGRDTYKRMMESHCG